MNLRLPFLLLAPALFTLLSASAQPFNWQWSHYATSNAGIPDVQGMATDALGNTYITGTFLGTATFGDLPPITSVGEADIYVAKYSNQGVALWAVQAGGTLTDVSSGLAVDNTGGLTITGYFYSPTVTFGPTTLTRVGLMDIHVARLDASTGTFQWAQRFGSNDFQSNVHTERALAVACDPDGHSYITGCFKYTLEVPGLPTLQGCNQYYTSFILKLAPNGTGVWSRRVDCGRHWSYSAGEGQAITVGADGMLYAGFRVRGDTLFVEGDTLVNMQTSGQAHDAVVVRYDLDGQPQWTRQIGAYGYDDVQALQADAEGNLYVGVHREGSYGYLGLLNIEWSGGQGTYKNVVLKIDAEGNFLRGARLGNSSYDHDIRAMLLEAPDKLLVGGWHQGNFDINGVVPTPGNVGMYGLYLARFDSSLTLMDTYARRYTYPRGISGIGMDEGANLYIVGYFSDSLVVPGLAPMTVGPGNGAIFLARSGDFPTVQREEENATGVRAWPVPSTGSVDLTSDGPFDGVRLLDPLGRVVLNETVPAARGYRLVYAAPGTYLCQLSHQGRPVGSCRILITGDR